MGGQTPSSSQRLEDRDREEFLGINKLPGTAKLPLPLYSGLTLSMLQRKVVSQRNQDELYIKNLHVGGTAGIGYCIHMLLCVFQVHLRSGLSGRVLGCSPGQDLKPFHCLPVPSHTTPACKRPTGIS